MSRTYSTQAIVLRRRNLAETDKIVVLFTRELGKLSAVAKGARRPQSRIAGATEPPTFLRALMAVGRDLDVVTQCETKESFLELRADLDRLVYCSYLLEMTDTLLEERLPHPDLFDLLLSALYLLNGGADGLALSAAFSLQAAEDAGFGPMLDSCVGCHEPVGSGVAGYSVRMGGVLCRACRGASRDVIRFPASARNMAVQLLDHDLPTIARLMWPRRDALGLTRVLRRHIEHRTEKKLKSAEFLEGMRLRDTETDSPAGADSEEVPGLPSGRGTPRGTKTDLVDPDREGMTLRDATTDSRSDLDQEEMPGPTSGRETPPETPLTR